MKELSIEEKAKAYDELFVKAKQIYNKENDVLILHTIEDLFPELKESEDEKNLTDLIDELKCSLRGAKWQNDACRGGQEKRIALLEWSIAWLEKQKAIDVLDEEEREFADNVDSYRKEVDAAYQKGYNEGVRVTLEKQVDIIENNMLLPFKEYDNLMDSINKKKKEGYEAGYKQGLIDSKNDQHVQPKFKVGDTIRIKNSSAEYVITDIYGGCYHGKGWGLDIISADRSGDYELVEKQGEQKPVDKVELKFHEGDWVVYDHRPYQVVELPKEGYINLGLRRNGKIEFAPSTYCRHWSIQDAKDGDVLVCESGERTLECLFIFKLIADREVHEYCSYRTIDKHFSLKDSFLGYVDNVYHPATKEQRDLLFQKMHEAGYEWDEEKKEPKKIIVPIFNIGDTIAKKHNSDIHDFGSFVITDITGGKYWYNDRIICDITEQDEWELYEPVRKNSTEWSEEDEYKYNTILHYLDLRKEKYKKECDQEEQDRYQCLYDWFKSLKDRVQPQPKQEWSEVDENHVKSILSTIECCKAQFPNSQAVVEAYNADIEWLNSLRPKNIWKPSEEQIKALALATLPDVHMKYQEALKELYEQLKKLKG